jgi:hypothetical protein
MDIAKVADTNTFPMKIMCFAINKIAQDHHQCLNFRSRSVPIFGAESVQREITYALRFALLNYPSDIFCPSTMTECAWSPTLLCPSSIAIHDYCDVLWDRIHRKLQFQ